MKEEEIIWMLKTEFFKDVGNYDATVTEYANWLQTKLVGIISRSSDIINLLTSRPVVDDIDEDEQQMVEMLDNGVAICSFVLRRAAKLHIAYVVPRFFFFTFFFLNKHVFMCRN